MVSEALTAWILHKYRSGDTSVQITFFTRDYGIIRCLYKGGWMPKRRSMLQLFTPLWLNLNKVRDRNYVRQLEPLTPVPQLTDQLLFSALYLNELLYHMLRPMDSHPDLFDAYTDSLGSLSGSVMLTRLQLEAILRRFELRLLTACGYQVSLTHDAQDTCIQPDQLYRLVPGDGFYKSQEGLLGRCILAFGRGVLNEVEVLKVAKWIMRHSIDHALDGKMIRARELYTQVPSKQRFEGT